MPKTNASCGMWRLIQVIRILYERVQNALGKMCALRTHTAIIKDNLGRSKFRQTLVLLFSNITRPFPALPGRLQASVPRQVRNSPFPRPPCLQGSRRPRLLPASLFSSSALASSGLGGPGRPPFGSSCPFPHLTIHKTWRIQCWRGILPISGCPHPSRWGLGTLSRIMAVVPVPSCQANPHLDCSFHWEYFLLSFCVYDSPSELSKVSCPRLAFLVLWLDEILSLFIPTSCVSFQHLPFSAIAHSYQRPRPPALLRRIAHPVWHLIDTLSTCV